MYPRTPRPQEGPPGGAGEAMTVNGPTRRKVLHLLAGAAAALATPAAAEVPVVRWRGVAFGAEAVVSIRDPDRTKAERALAACRGEIERIERVFSLRRRDSALARLNAEGAIEDPPAELVEALSFASHLSRISDGAFDVTVQPLWGIYVRAQRNRFRRARAFAAAVDEARSRIDWRRLAVSADRIRFSSSGMATTLNGLVQGYATDRIAERLRSAGFPHVLVDLGELRGMGERRPGEPWRIGVGAPGHPDVAAVIDLADGAVATSSPQATAFDAAVHHHHLFDPHTGRSAQSWSSVSVVAPTAMLADALSTAIAVAPRSAAEALLAAGGGARAVLMDGDRIVHLRA